jgi:membrane protease YdiL (CAAX protease family)
MGDILLGVAFIVTIVIAATIGGLFVVGLDALRPLAEGDLDSNDAVIFLGLATLAQGLAMGLWPVIVARWKGRGVVADFGLRLRPIDLLIGIGSAVAMLVVAGGIAAVLSDALGAGSDESTNTQIIDDAAGTSAIWIIGIAAVLVAPIVEELFFRGLCLRAIEKRFGTTAAVIGSSVLFTLPHFTNPSVAGTVVLFAAIGTVGLALALLVVKTGRLGPAIIAHALFNGISVIGVLIA